MRTKNIALIALTIMLSIHIQRIEACTRAVYIGPDNLRSDHHDFVEFTRFLVRIRRVLCKSGHSGHETDGAKQRAFERSFDEHTIFLPVFITAMTGYPGVA